MYYFTDTPKEIWVAMLGLSSQVLLKGVTFQIVLYRSTKNIALAPKLGYSFLMFDSTEGFSVH